MNRLNRTPLVRLLSPFLAAAVLAAPFLGEAEPARMGVITGDGVTMREGPGTSFARTGRLARGEWVTILESSAQWLKVLDSRGQVAWVFERWVDEVPATPQAPDTGLLSVTTVETSPPAQPDSMPPPPMVQAHRRHVPWLWIGAGVVAAGVVGALAFSGDEGASTGSLGFRVEFP